jgi:lipopolysaccharide transport system ATP-binding protein
MKPIVRVEGLGKQYRIGRAKARYSTLREDLMSALQAPWKRLRDRQSEKLETVWALRNIDFEIPLGQTVGLIGRNGAGKSTLLKILSRITEPTSGKARLRGRVGSLLEVGTGFHPELTGRENVFLAGAILGMRRKEIASRFDEIVAFSEVERFLDTPVKHYSSGMYMRLAFAVAAHLETELLLIDEVLAVGDAQFQKKCLGKMEQIGSSGRTVIFVSHNMPAVLRLCNRVILLHQGRLIGDGDPHKIAIEYMRSDIGSCAERVWPDREEAPGNSVARLHAVRVINTRNDVVETIDIREPLQIEVEYWNLQEHLRPSVSLQFTNEDGVCLLTSNDFNNRSWAEARRNPGLVRCRCCIPGNFLAEGQVFILAALCTYNPDQIQAVERDVVSFQVVDHSDGDGVRGVYAGPWPGLVRPMLDWQIDTEYSEVAAPNAR